MGLVISIQPSNPNIKLPDEFLIDGVKYSKHVNKPRVNADMAVNVKLDTTDAIKSINDLKEALNGITDHPKIHELSNQPLVAYLSDGSITYVWDSSDHEIVALINKPNTRLAIIENDTNA